MGVLFLIFNFWSAPRRVVLVLCLFFLGVAFLGNDFAEGQGGGFVGFVNHSSREIYVDGYADLQVALDDLLARIGAVNSSLGDGSDFPVCGGSRNTCLSGSVLSARTYAGQNSYLYYWLCSNQRGNVSCSSARSRS